MNILVPELYISLNVIFQFLNEFPPVMHINRDLFARVDIPLTDEVRSIGFGN